MPSSKRQDDNRRGVPCARGGKQEERVVRKEDKEALQVAKEFVVKFIEVGRISPSNFEEIFPVIYRQVLRTILAGKDIVGEASALSPHTAEPDRKAD